MITDKDRAELKELTKQIRKSNQTMQWFDYGWDECAEILMQYVNNKCAESAEQARKEAAEEIKRLKIKCNNYAKRLVLEGFDDVEWEAQTILSVDKR